MTTRLLLCAILSTAIPPILNAAVIVDSNISFSTGSNGFSYFNVFQDEGHTDLTGALFQLSDGFPFSDFWTLALYTTTVDEGNDWYFVSYGDSFSQSTIARGDFPRFDRIGIEIDEGDFYLGVNTGRGFAPDGRIARDVFGWVHLRHLNGTLTMLGNAMSYHEAGIVVGTNRAIPEPAASFLSLAGLIIAFSSRFRRA